MTDLTIDQLTEGELRDLEGLGRIKDGKVLAPPAKPVVPADPTNLSPDLIPSAPEGVKERLAAGKELHSSFVHKEGDKVVSSSPDGGKTANSKVETNDNPDWVGKPKEDPIEAEDKAKFLAHMLGATHFKKTYALFDGAVNVTFRTRTGAEDLACHNQTWDDDKIDGTFLAGSNEARSSRIMRLQNYQFSVSLKAIKFGGDVPREYDAMKTKGTPEAHIGPLRAAYDNLMLMPTPLLVAIRQAHMRFEVMVARLIMAAETKDFWKAGSGT